MRVRVDDEEEMAQEIKCDREALQMAEKLFEYARFKGNEKLSPVQINSFASGNSYSKPETIFNF